MVQRESGESVKGEKVIKNFQVSKLFLPVNSKCAWHGRLPVPGLHAGTVILFAQVLYVCFIYFLLDRSKGHLNDICAVRQEL